MAKGKGEKDLTEQARNTGQRMRSSAAALMEPGFSSMAPKANARVRTQPGDAQQVNAAPANQMNGSPSAMPTPYASGGRVGKCMKCGGAAHKGMCEGGKMAKGGQPKHDDEAADKKLFSKMFKQKEASEAPEGMKKGGKKNWIAGAVKKPGALHRELGVPEGKKIPEAKIEAASHSSNPKLRQRANFAKTVKGFASGGSANLEADEPAPMQKNKIVPGAAGAGPGVPRSKVAKYAVGGIAKIRHEEMTKDQKQTPNKPSGWNAYK